MRWLPADPRYWQITMLSALLLYGVFRLDFEVEPATAALILGTGQLVQWVGSRATSTPYDPKSALISSLSLCLLLRSNSLAVAALGAAIAVGSKFVLRWNGKHLFNPTNLALACLLLGNVAWVSPGQWGSQATLAFFFGCLGGLVVYRAERSDVTYAFFAFYLSLLFGRSIYLGEPLTIPLHRIQSGSLLLFGFFMISDPRTTPDHRIARVLFAALVALGAWTIQFRYFHTNGLIWALAVVSTFTPLLDWLFRGQRYRWPTPLTRSLA